MPVTLANGEPFTDTLDPASVMYWFSSPLAAQTMGGRRKLPPLLEDALRRDFPILSDVERRAILIAYRKIHE